MLGCGDTNEHAEFLHDHLANTICLIIYYTVVTSFKICELPEFSLQYQRLLLNSTHLATHLVKKTVHSSASYYSSQDAAGL